MNIIISEKALSWFKEEMEVNKVILFVFMHDTVVLLHFMKGFSLGMNREEPHDIGIESVVRWNSFLY